MDKKYVIILGDGMADRPVPELGGKTPIEYAKTPVMDSIAPRSEIGMVQTIPEGMSPGSDTANLSVLGYDPKLYYSGRSPLEALSIGVDMKKTDVALRMNLVTLSEDEEKYENRKILDHSSGEISTEEAAGLVEALRKEFENDTYKFYVGTSYRHLLIWDMGEVQKLVQPHDVLGQVIGDKLPADEKLREMMIRSYEILENHPINKKRRAEGKNPANSAWFWGAGTRPALSPFTERTGKSGAMISAVDLLKGIAVGASMKNVIVSGANGQLETNYEGKAQAAVDVLVKDGYDFVYVHVEAPDEMGHQGSFEKKVRAIEYLDGRLIKNVKAGLEQAGADFRMLIMPDHPTPIELRTHTSDPVPFMIYDSTKNIGTGGGVYSEKYAETTGVKVEKGCMMIDRLMEK